MVFVPLVSLAVESTAPEAPASRPATDTPRPDGPGGGTDASPFAYELPKLQEPQPVSWWSVMGNLLLVLGLLGMVFWVVRRLLPGQLGEARRSRHMRVLDTMTVGLNRTLMLVNVGGEVRLIANTEKGISDLGPVKELGAIEGEIAEEFTQTLRDEMADEGGLARLRGRLRQLGEGQ